VNDARPDQELVRSYLSGDAAAFSVLVERHQARVFNVCLRLLGNGEDAADATQDAFLVALRKLGQFRGDAAFSTWLHRVAVNASYDILRKQRRQPMLKLARDGDDAAEPEPGVPAPDHSDEVAGTTDVTRALARVPEDFRVALVLADIQDLPYEEISKVLDVPVGTVKSRVHRGRLALAREMGIEPQREPRRPSRASDEQRPGERAPGERAPKEASEERP
jgi:RNA polymerase sigma-70 factor (ECF subfamily)